MTIVPVLGKHRDKFLTCSLKLQSVATKMSRQASRHTVYMLGKVGEITTMGTTLMTLHLCLCNCLSSRFENCQVGPEVTVGDSNMDKKV